MLRLGVVAHAPAAQRLERRLLQLLHRAPPLQRDARLDATSASIADGDRVPVRLALFEAAVLLQPFEHARVGFLLRQPLVLAHLCVHASVGPDHRELRQLVVAPDLVIQRVVTRRHFQRAGAEVPLDALVRDHRHAALDDGDDHLAADQRLVALVLRVHGDRHVREDRRRPHGGDRDVSVAVGERIPDVRERVVDLDVRELEIGERGQVERAPVDDPVRAVDPALLVEMHEEAHHRPHVSLVHGEALAPVVERRARAAELEHDLPAVLAQPFPNALLECLAAQVLARLPLSCEVLFDRVLRRDAGVVEAGLEERVVALHPARADDRVRERELERVAEVQVARDVRRRVGDREALVRGVGVGVVVPLFLPGPLPALFDALGLVERFHLARDPSLASEAPQGTGEITQRLWLGV